MRKDERKQGASSRSKTKRERRKDFSRLAFPKKRAILFIDKKILSYFALTFHDFLSREASIQESWNRPETSWIFFLRLTEDEKMHLFSRAFFWERRRSAIIVLCPFFSFPRSPERSECQKCFPLPPLHSPLLSDNKNLEEKTGEGCKNGGKEGVENMEIVPLLPIFLNGIRKATLQPLSIWRHIPSRYKKIGSKGCWHR